MLSDEQHRTSDGIVSFSPDDPAPVKPTLLSHFPPNMSMPNQGEGHKPGIFGIDPTGNHVARRRHTAIESHT